MLLHYRRELALEFGVEDKSRAVQLMFDDVTLIIWIELINNEFTVICFMVLLLFSFFFFKCFFLSLVILLNSSGGLLIFFYPSVKIIIVHFLRRK